MSDKTMTLAQQRAAATPAKPRLAAKDKAISPKVKTKVKFFSKTWHKVVLGLSIFLTILLCVGGVISYHYYKIGLEVKSQAQVLMASGRTLADQLKTQNLPAAAVALDDTQAAYQDFKNSYSQLSGLKALPYYGQFLRDGDIALEAGEYAFSAADKALEAIMPYADLLGFSGEEKTEEEGGNTEDRIKKIIETLNVISPELDNISAELTQMQAVLEQINPEPYPTRVDKLLPFKILTLFKPDLKEYADFNLQEVAASSLTLADQASTAFAEYRPVIELLPRILGGEGERQKYLILFQNDNELRPTGGFLTAYSIIYMEDGKVFPEKSDDIYELDKKFNKQIPIPAELGRYLTTEKYWNMRDMNIDPDFNRSMDVFFEHYQEVKGEPTDIDGIIAIDTNLLTDLIDVLGPVEVPGYGTFSTEPDQKYTDAPQVVVALSEIITRPTPYIREDRKGILGPMMQALLSKVYSAPRQVMPQLFQVALANIEGRHVQVYFIDPELQTAIETINAAGRMIPPASTNEDFLAIVDANLGGAKSNLFISYSVKQDIELPEADQINKRVEITYQNSRPGDNCNLEAGLLCLNATNNDWQRIYLPEGSALIKAQGYKNEPRTYSEGGFTVIDGFFSLDPNKTAKIILEYTVPYTDQDLYTLNIWKQGGIREIPNLINVNGNEEEILVTGDTRYQALFD